MTDWDSVARALRERGIPIDVAKDPQFGPYVSTSSPKIRTLLSDARSVAANVVSRVEPIKVREALARSLTDFDDGLVSDTVFRWAYKHWKTHSEFPTTEHLLRTGVDALHYHLCRFGIPDKRERDGINAAGDAAEHANDSDAQGDWFEAIGTSPTLDAKSSRRVNKFKTWHLNDLVRGSSKSVESHHQLQRLLFDSIGSDKDVRSRFELLTGVIACNLSETDFRRPYSVPFRALAIAALLRSESRRLGHGQEEELPTESGVRLCEATIAANGTFVDPRRLRFAVNAARGSGVSFCVVVGAAVATAVTWPLPLIQSWFIGSPIGVAIAALLGRRMVRRTSSVRSLPIAEAQQFHEAGPRMRELSSLAKNLNRLVPQVDIRFERVPWTDASALLVDHRDRCYLRISHDGHSWFVEPLAGRTRSVARELKLASERTRSSFLR